MGYDPESPDVIGRQTTSSSGSKYSGFLDTPTSTVKGYSPNGKAYSYKETIGGVTYYRNASGTLVDQVSSSSGSPGSSGPSLSPTTVFVQTTPGTTAASSYWRNPQTGDLWLIDELDPSRNQIILPGQQQTPDPKYSYFTGPDGNRYYTDYSNPGVAIPVTGYGQEPGGGMEYDFGTDAQGRDYYFDPSNPAAGYQYLNPAGGSMNNRSGYSGPVPTAPSAIPILSSGFNQANTYRAMGGGSSSSRAPTIGDQAALDFKLKSMQAENQLKLEYQQQSRNIADATRGDERRFQAEQDELDRQFQWRMFEIQQQAQRAQEQRLLTDQFMNAVGQTDPTAFAALMHAQGTIGNAINAGGAVTDAAIYPAAQALSQLAGQQAPPPTAPPTGTTPPPSGGVPPPGGGTTTPPSGTTPPPSTPPPSGMTFEQYPEDLAMRLRAYELMNPEAFAGDKRPGMNALQRIVDMYFSAYDAGQQAHNSKTGVLGKYQGPKNWARELDQQISGGTATQWLGQRERFANVAGPATRDPIAFMQKAQQKVQELGGTLSNQRNNPVTGELEILGPQIGYQFGNAPEGSPYAEDIDRWARAYNSAMASTNPSTEIDLYTQGSLAPDLAANNLGLYHNPNGVGMVAFQKDAKGNPIPGTGFEYKPASSDPSNPFNPNAPQPTRTAPAGGFTTGLPRYATEDSQYDYLNPGIQYRAGGGPVSFDRPIVVGEREPELIIPSAVGAEVIPFSQIPGMADGGTIYSSFRDFRTQTGGNTEDYAAYKATLPATAPAISGTTTTPTGGGSGGGRGRGGSAVTPPPPPVTPPTQPAPAQPQSPFYQPGSTPPPAQTPTPQAPVPQQPAPQVPAPQTPAPQTPVPQTPAPTTPTPVSQPIGTPAPTTPDGAPLPTNTVNYVLPENLQDYGQQVRDIRENAQYPSLNLLDPAWDFIDPYVKQVYLQGLQSQYGIPVASSQFEQSKWRMPGYGGLRMGY